MVSCVWVGKTGVTTRAGNNLLRPRADTLYVGSYSLVNL